MNQPVSRLTTLKPVLAAAEAAAAHQTLSVGTGAAVATTSITKGASTKFFVIGVDDESVRVVLDGTTAPTASVGVLYPAGAVIVLSRSEFLAAKFIGIGGTATLQVVQETD